MKRAILAISPFLCLGVSAQATTLNNNQIIASSPIEFSNVQGTADFTYGYYDRSADLGGVYSGTEFTALPVSGGGYALGGNPPWTSISDATSGHPNMGGGEHWVIRRFTVPAAQAGAIDINWFIRKSSVACGDGVTGYLFHNGTQIDSSNIDFNDGAGTLKSASVVAAAGDTIDVIVSPRIADDFCDGTHWGMELAKSTTQTYITTLIADSVADFGQNTNGWTYGIYAGGSPGGWTPFNDPADWIGGATTIWSPAGTPPWTEIDEAYAHPNGTNSGALEHATRRYTVQSGEAGNLVLDIDLAKTNPNGDGVTAYVYHNGTKIWDVAVSGWDTIGWDGSVEIPGANVGDTIDLVLGPESMAAHLGYGSGSNDGADGSNYSMRIYQVIPEPTAPLLLALASLALVRRKRQ